MYQASDWETGRKAAFEALQSIKANGLSQRPEYATFFIIWCPTSKLPPTVRFDTADQAHKIADKMAREHQATFYVLQALQEVRPVHTVTTRLA